MTTFVQISHNILFYTCTISVTAVLSYSELASDPARLPRISVFIIRCLMQTRDSFHRVPGGPIPCIVYCSSQSDSAPWPGDNLSQLFGNSFPVSAPATFPFPFCFPPYSIWLSRGACTISISCGYPVADSRHESRHHPAGECRGNAKRQTRAHPLCHRPQHFSPSCFVICLHLSSPLSFLILPHLLFFSLPRRASSVMSFTLLRTPKRWLWWCGGGLVRGMRAILWEYREPSKRTTRAGARVGAGIGVSNTDAMPGTGVFVVPTEIDIFLCLGTLEFDHAASTPRDEIN